jgi:hypothetical protein
MFKLLRITCPVAFVLALAIAAPAVFAMPASDASSVQTVEPSVVASHVSSTGGTSFDWGSAAAGAGGALLIVALISAGVVMTGRARLTTTR